MKYKVVFTDSILKNMDFEIQTLSDADAEFIFLDTTDREKIMAAVVDADALMVSYAEIDADIIKTMQKCKCISKAGIGINNIDVKQASKQGIRVTNVPNYCIEEVSDVVIALALSFTRRIPFLWNTVRGGEWCLSGGEGITRLNGKVFGFLGFGQIARRAAEKIKPFGVKLLAYDPFIDAQIAIDEGVELAELNEVIGSADILSLNLPLNDETTGMVDRKFLNRMKKNAILINTSRGALINEPDFCDAILAGEIAGAGLDVICNETYDQKNPLFKLPNVIITPHAAFYSPDAAQELREKLLTEVIAVLGGKEPKYQVNSI